MEARQMAKLTWNDDVGPNFARQAAAAFSAKAQAILDEVHRTASGEDVAAVKATLWARWQSEMGQLPDETLLDKFAERLAAGQRVVLSPTGTYSE
jgi:hypothetical protein